MKRFMILAVLTAACMGSVSASASGRLKLDNVYPQFGRTVSVVNDDISAWMPEIDYETAGRYVKRGTDHYQPKPVVMEWSTRRKCGSFIVDVATTADMTDMKSYETVSPRLVLTNPKVGTTYYWRVSSGEERRLKQSPVYIFITDGTHRTVSVAGVSNTRDIGGCEVEGGLRIRQGMLFRGASLASVTDAGRLCAVDTLHIKTDLDLRSSAEAGNLGSPLGGGIRYYNLSCPYYKDGATGIESGDLRGNLRQVFAILADSSNYPIYFHCAIGRDRTGTLAMLVEGLLGASKKDIYTDYTMSFFSKAGFGMDQADDRTMIRDHFSTMYNFILTYSDGSFRQNVQRYLLDIGVTMDEIMRIRDILLE